MYFVNILLAILIVFAYGCIDENSREKSTCGCQSYSFMKIKGKRFYCERTKNYRHVFLSSNFPERLISIQLSQNKLDVISTDFFPPGINSSIQTVIELSLSNNEITYIASGAFKFFTNLKSLNLSYNRIGRLHLGIFEGLNKLRNLYLNYNNFPTIPGNAFTYLTSLKRLSVQSDYLVCNCLMKDFFLWYQKKANLKIVGKCKYPKKISNMYLRDVVKNANLPNCDHPTTLPYFEIKPSFNQVLFAGDQLRLYCEGTDFVRSVVHWNFNGNVVDINFESFDENTTTHYNRSTIASYLHLTSSPRWSGRWECMIASNYSMDSRPVNLLVLNITASYCDPDTVSNDRGVYHWPQAVAGVLLSLNCAVPENGVLNVAKRSCLEGGVWSAGNYSQCSYTDPIARKFLRMLDIGMNNKTTMMSMCNDSSSDLKPSTISSVIGLQLTTRLMTSCLRFSNLSQHVVGKLVQLISLSMTLPPLVAMDSTNLSETFGEVRKVVARLLFDSIINSSYNQNSGNVAIQMHSLYLPIACNVSITRNNTGLLCYRIKPGTNLVHPGMYIPVDVASTTGINIVVYRNPRLFQPQRTFLLNNNQYLQYNRTTPPNGDNTSASSYAGVRPLVYVSGVYSVLGQNTMSTNFSEPVELVFKTNEKVLLQNNRHYVAIWDAGRWRKVEKSECEPVFSTSFNVTKVKCHQMGSYVVIKDIFVGDESLGDNAFQFLHPSVYISTSFLSVSLVFIITTYVIFPRLLVSCEAHHIVINTSFHVLLAALVFVLSIKSFNNEGLCYASGLLLHYSSLSVLVWLLLGARNMGKEMVASQHFPTSEPKPKRPIIRFYLLACGIPVIVCGITAAAKIENYHDEAAECCWLSWETSIYAFYVPAALTAISCLLILLRILATLSSDASGSRECETSRTTGNLATEVTPLHQSSSVQASLLSINKQNFNEQGFAFRLRGVALTLLLFILMWIFAAMIIASPQIESSTSLNSDLQYIGQSTTSGETLRIVFSFLFSICAASFALFQFYQHVSSRSDATTHWKKFLCCRKCQTSLIRESSHDNKTDVTSNVKSLNTIHNCATTPASATEDLTFETALPDIPGGEPSHVVSSKETNPLAVIGRPDGDARSVEQLHHIDHNKTSIKLTNLKCDRQRRVESSVTEHSPDEALNMHTVPVLLQPLANQHFNNRCKKLRTNMKGRRASKKKLRVLRTYAHDPLTSNDETGDVSRHSTHHDVDNLTLDNQMMENLAIREYLKADEEERLNQVNVKERNFRPLLISSPRKKGSSSERMNPNMASSYYGKAPSSQDHSLSAARSDDGFASSIYSRPQVATSVNSTKGKSHNYLTAAAVLCNPFHVPGKTRSHNLRSGPPHSEDAIIETKL